MSGIWAAIAGGSGQYLKQEEEKRIAEKERLAAELRKAERNEELARDDARHMDRLQFDRDKQLMDAETDNRNRLDTNARYAADDKRADQQLKMQENQMRENTSMRREVKESNSLARAAQAENKAIRDQERAAKERQKMLDDEVNRASTFLSKEGGNIPAQECLALEEQFRNEVYQTFGDEPVEKAVVTAFVNKKLRDYFAKKNSTAAGDPANTGYIRKP